MDFSEHFRSMLERRAAGHLKRGQRNSLLATRAIQKRSDRREILKIKARRRAKEGAQLEEAGDHRWSPGKARRADIHEATLIRKGQSVPLTYYKQLTVK